MIREISTGKVLSKVKVNSFIYEIWVKSDLPFTFKAGQFVSFFISDREARAYSIASSPRYNIDENKFRLIIGPTPGSASDKYIENLNVGESVKFRGGFGIFTIDRIIPDISYLDPNSQFVFIATNTGIAPFISMLEYLADLKVKNQISVYFGIRHYNDLMFEENFIELEKKLNLKYYYCISQPEERKNENLIFHHCYVTPLVIANQSAKDYFFICGSTKVVTSISTALRESSFPNIFFENYG